MKKAARRRRTLRALLTMTFVWCFVINVIALPAYVISAEEYDIDSPNLGLDQVEEPLRFVWHNSDGELNKYNFYIMYEHTEEDVKTLGNMLMDPTKSKGVYIRKYDANADGQISIIDYMELYKDVYLPPEGYWHEGQWYAYNLIKPAWLTYEDIQLIAKILAKLYVPLGGVEISYYDYNYNGEIDLADLVRAKKYRATNPCNFLRDRFADNTSTSVDPNELAALLEAAEAFGLDNFEIVEASTQEIPYSIFVLNRMPFKLDEAGYEVKPMQIIPPEDTVLSDYGYEPVENYGEYGMWRWCTDKDDTIYDDDILWYTEETAHYCYTTNSAFVLIPIDENGNRLGTLYPSAKEAKLAPEGVTFAN